MNVELPLALHTPALQPVCSFLTNGRVNSQINSPHELWFHLPCWFCVSSNCCLAPGPQNCCLKGRVFTRKP